MIEVRILNLIWQCKEAVQMGPSEEQIKEMIRLGLLNLIGESYNTAKDKGWHDGAPRSVVEEIALMHSELSEAVEEIRNHKPNFYLSETGKPEGVAVEFADVLIRIADTCGARGIDLASAVAAKLEYNKSRPYRHGGKAL